MRLAGRAFLHCRMRVLLIFISTLVCAPPRVYAGSTYANYMQLDVKSGPTVIKQDGSSTPMSAVQSVLEIIAGQDSCTSTRSADSVETTADTVNCDLTASTDNGATAGSCAVPAGSSATHTCAYVVGTWAAVSLVRCAQSPDMQYIRARTALRWYTHETDLCSVLA
jgi:hypothetical protein